METLQAGRADQWQMLDAAESSLAEVEPSATRVVPLRSTRPGEAAASLEPPPPPVAPPAAPRHRQPRRSLAGRARAGRHQRWIRNSCSCSSKRRAKTSTRLPTLFPQWEQNPLDAEALRDVRRAFHTLKGSGRMVGAHRVGEFSWSIENAAESRDQPDAAAFAGHRRDRARRRRGHAAAGRRDRRAARRPASTSRRSWRGPTRCPAGRHRSRRCRRHSRHRAAPCRGLPEPRRPHRRRSRPRVTSSSTAVDERQATSRRAGRAGRHGSGAARDLSARRPPATSLVVRAVPRAVRPCVAPHLVTRSAVPRLPHA